MTGWVLERLAPLKIRQGSSKAARKMKSSLTFARLFNWGDFKLEYPCRPRSKPSRLPKIKILKVCLKSSYDIQATFSVFVHVLKVENSYGPNPHYFLKILPLK